MPASSGSGTTKDTLMAAAHVSLSNVVACKQTTRINPQLCTLHTVITSTKMRNEACSSQFKIQFWDRFCLLLPAYSLLLYIIFSILTWVFSNHHRDRPSRPWTVMIQICQWKNDKDPRCYRGESEVSVVKLHLYNCFPKSNIGSGRLAREWKLRTSQNLQWDGLGRCG